MFLRRMERSRFGDKEEFILAMVGEVSKAL